MNIDPLDIFGETLAQPVKRFLLFASGLFMGGWIGEISMNVDHGVWEIFGWDEFADGFLWPIGVLFSSAGLLLIPGFLVFLLSSWRLDWMWFIAAAGVSLFVLVDGEADIGWVAWAVLNTGLAGMVWLNATWQKTRWARELSELSAYNSMQRALRESETDEDECPDDDDDGDECPDDGDDQLESEPPEERLQIIDAAASMICTAEVVSCNTVPQRSPAGSAADKTDKNQIAT